MVRFEWARARCYSLELLLSRATNAPLAQSAEQLTLNQWVPGSSPGGRTENPVSSHESWIFFI